MMRGRGWLVGIASMVLLCAGGALTLTLVASAFTARAEAYFAQYDFSTAGPIDIDEVEYETYNGFSVISGNLMSVAVPLMFCTFAAGAVLLAVLAHRYDQARMRALPAQAEATAAS